ncbi:MAG: alpha/beta fold hydrolase, partial [Solirubrobacterales bacterium]
MSEAAIQRPATWGKPGEELGPYEEVELHGHTIGFQAAGDGPLLILLHGITSTSEAWREVMPRLAERYTVIAPDMIGHGRSAKPRGDYSLGAYAAGVRDLLAVLGFERGTVVGHSLGGGIAMQFAYLFPEYVERMALISSGGLGQEVHPLLRAATLPGSEWVLPLLAREWSVTAGDAIRTVASKLGLAAGPDLAEFARGYASLVEEGATEAFLDTLRSVIGPEGQKVSALDR